MNDGLDMKRECQTVISVNVDIDSRDAEAAGESGLYGRYSYGRYGAREGLWRLLELFADEDLAATFFVETGDAQRHPDLIEALCAAGHEIAPQSTVVSSDSPRGPADIDSIETVQSSWKELTGKAPAGWRASNGLLTKDVLDELARLGFLYDSSFEDDDALYVLETARGPLVELPVFQFLNDATFYSRRHLPERARAAWLEEADALHADGGYIHLTLHLRGDVGSARAVRVNVVRDFIRNLNRKPGVQFMTCAQLAAGMDAGAGEPVPDYPMTPSRSPDERISPGAAGMAAAGDRSQLKGST